MRGSKISDEKKEKVRALLESGVSVKEIHDKTGVNENTIYSWKNNEFQDDDEFTKLRNENKEKIIKSAWKHVNTCMNVIGLKLNRALDGEKKLTSILEKMKKSKNLSDDEMTKLLSLLKTVSYESLSDVSRTFGVLIDKINILTGESTENININNRKFEDM